MRTVVFQLDAAQIMRFDIDRDTNLMNVFNYTGNGVITTDPDFDLVNELTPSVATGGRVFYEVIRMQDFVLAPVFVPKGTSLYFVAQGAWTSQVIFDDVIPST
jgi:hypothetical protein